MHLVFSVHFVLLIWNIFVLKDISFSVYLVLFLHSFKSASVSFLLYIAISFHVISQLNFLASLSEQDNELAVRKGI